MPDNNIFIIPLDNSWLEDNKQDIRGTTRLEGLCTIVYILEDVQQKGELCLRSDKQKKERNREGEKEKRSDWPYSCFPHWQWQQKGVFIL
ncbi:MAG: hypothetical protein M0O96_05315 [Desulforhopalus sp.]|nr:hypothetical protein [Desulforhopalus sp.]